MLRKKPGGCQETARLGRVSPRLTSGPGGSSPKTVTHWDVSSGPGRLFDADVPDGFHYRDDFITRGDEAVLADEIARLEFATFEMRGVAARRRVAFFGQTYDSGSASTPPLPPFLMPLRDKVAAWARVEAHAFTMALVNEYPPGAPIGWHRDAPQYGIVAGLSLLSACRMKFRPYRTAGRTRRDAGSAADRDSRDHARAPIGVPDDRRGEECLRAPHSCRDHVALFDYVPDSPILSSVGTARPTAGHHEPQGCGEHTGNP